MLSLQIGSRFWLWVDKVWAGCGEIDIRHGVLGRLDLVRESLVECVKKQCSVHACNVLVGVIVNERMSKLVNERVRVGFERFFSCLTCLVVCFMILHRSIGFHENHV